MLKLQVLEFVTRPDPVYLPPDLERALRAGIPGIEALNGFCEWTWNEFTVSVNVQVVQNICIVKQWEDGFRSNVFCTANIKIVAPTFTSNDAHAVVRMFDWTHHSSPFITACGKHFNSSYKHVWCVYGKYVAFWQAWSVPVCDDLRRTVWGFLSELI